MTTAVIDDPADAVCEEAAGHYAVLHALTAERVRRVGAPLPPEVRERVLVRIAVRAAVGR